MNRTKSLFNISRLIKGFQNWRDNKRNREQQELIQALRDRIDRIEKARRLYVYCGLCF